MSEIKAGTCPRCRAAVRSDGGCPSCGQSITAAAGAGAVSTAGDPGPKASGQTGRAILRVQSRWIYRAFWAGFCIGAACWYAVALWACGTEYLFREWYTPLLLLVWGPIFAGMNLGGLLFAVALVAEAQLRSAALRLDPQAGLIARNARQLARRLPAAQAASLAASPAAFTTTQPAAGTAGQAPARRPAGKRAPTGFSAARRRLALLLAVLLGATLLTCTWHWQRSIRRREAYERLTRRGAVFGWDHRDTYYGVNLSARDVGDPEVELLEVFTDFDSIDLQGTRRVTDEGVRHLKGLHRLESLDLSGTNVTDAGLVYLRGLDRLTLLGLRGTKVTDAGLDNLRGMSRLEYLNLAATQVTDGGLQKLETLTSLRKVYAARTGVTGVGIRRLRAALPALEVDTKNDNWRLGQTTPQALLAARAARRRAGQ